MKYSKTAHINLIYEIANGVTALTSDKQYLELGIAKARCFNKVSPLFNFSVAVDIEPKANTYIKSNSDNAFHNCPNEIFFKTNKDMFDLIFIDANHRFEYVQKDFVESEKVLNENGIIIIHDTWPPDEDSNKHCYDSWKMQDMDHDDFELINLPFFYGLLMFKRHERKPWWV